MEAEKKKILANTNLFRRQLGLSDGMISKEEERRAMEEYERVLQNDPRWKERQKMEAECDGWKKAHWPQVESLYTRIDRIRRSFHTQPKRCGAVIRWFWDQYLLLTRRPHPESSFWQESDMPVQIL